MRISFQKSSAWFTSYSFEWKGRLGTGPMQAKIDVGSIHVTCAQDIRELGFCNMEYIPRNKRNLQSKLSSAITW